jgi:predicted enzyme related to lactoylglutathione lyase
MLSGARIHTTLPAADFGRARKFYEETLGFEPFDERPAAVMYRAGEGTVFTVFPSSGAASGTHTQMGITVDDVSAAVADLKARGVTCESYDFPGFDKQTSIADAPGTRAAWFKDTEGNLIGLIQFVDAG